MAEKAEKLQAFVWEGKDRKGDKTKGEVSGHNLALVKAQLRKQGIIPDKVKKKPKPLFGGSKKITPFDIAMLTRQLATIAALTSVETWEQFRRSHGRTAAQTRRAWIDAIDRILPPPEPPQTQPSERR